MKFGVSCAAHEVDEALKYFDYAEVWDKAVSGYAYHSKSQERFSNSEEIKEYRPYVVVHTDAAPSNIIPGIMVENIPAEQPDHVASVLNGNDFLLDIGHAFTSNRYDSSLCIFDYDRWFALKPKALHFHDCRIDIPNPWKKPDAADHQLLGQGILPLQEILEKAFKLDVQYCTVECFMDGFAARQYSIEQRRAALDAVIPK